MDTRKLKKASAVLMLFLFCASFLIPQNVDAQTGSGIGVSNDPPSWVDIFVDDHNGHIVVHVFLKDLNGWSDIYNVTMVVLDGHGNEISNITWKQYRELDDTVPGTYWEENVGNYLVQEESWIDPVEIYPWNPENTEIEVGMNVSFALVPFSGETIKIYAYDMNEARCGYEGPFSADYEIPPYFEDNYMVPISISAVVGVLGALFIVWRRYYSNKLARMIENTNK